MKMKKMIALLGAAAMAISLAACGGSDSAGGSSSGNGSASESSSSESGGSEGSGQVQEVALHLPTVYDLPDAEMVETEINKIAEEKYGLHFDINYISTGSWQQQSNLLFTGDEADVIAIFGTPLTTFVKNGQLSDLTDYYANASDEFKAVWSAEEMEGTTIDGKIYAVPNLRNFGNYFGLNIDAEVAAELGIEDGQQLSMQDVSDFLYAAHEKYPERYALVPQGGTTLIGQWSWDGLGDERWVGVLEDCGQDTTVKNVLDIDDFTEFCTWAETWYNDGLILPDILSNTTPWQTPPRCRAISNCSASGLS